MVKIRLDPLLKAEGPEPFSFAIIPLSETFFLFGDTSFWMCCLTDI